MKLLDGPAGLIALGAVLLVASGINATRRVETATPPAVDACATPGCRVGADPLPARGYESAYVAANPADPRHIVVSSAKMLENRCGWHTTFDGGKEWTDGLFTLPDGFVGCRLNSPAGNHVPNGSVAMSPSGTVYSVFGSANPDLGAGDHILVAKSTDGGATFAPARVAASPPAGDMGMGRPLMTVAPGRSGRDVVLLSFWLCRPAVPTGTQCDAALLSKSDDSGGTFSPPVVVNDDPAGQNPSQPAIDTDGTIYQTFQRRYSDGPVDLLLATSRDGGATFTQSLITRQSQIGLRHDPAKLVFDPARNALYTVWSDNRTGRQQIFFKRSLDQGRTWSEADVVISPSVDGAGTSRSPSIAISPGGRIDVVYYYTEPAPAAQEFDHVYWSWSNDGGDIFRTRQVNDVPIDRTKGYSGSAADGGQVGNHYPPAVSATDAFAFVVWSDTRDADERTNSQDIMLRAMAAATTGTPP